MAKAYTTKTNVEKYLVKTINASENDNIAQFIESMSLMMDSYCARPLHDTEEATIKYDGTGGELLHVQDCNTVTAVVMDGMDITADIFEYPTTKDYTSRIALNGVNFNKGRQNIEVTAIPAMHGGETPPANIVQACTMLVGMMVRMQILGDDAGVTERMGDYTITYPKGYKSDMDLVKSILNGYRRISL